MREPAFWVSGLERSSYLACLNSGLIPGTPVILNCLML